MPGRKIWPFPPPFLTLGEIFSNKGEDPDQNPWLTNPQKNWNENIK